MPKNIIQLQVDAKLQDFKKIQIYINLNQGFYRASPQAHLAAHVHEPVHKAQHTERKNQLNRDAV